jgi:hypothetical protein
MEAPLAFSPIRTSWPCRRVDRDNKRGFGGSRVASNLSEYAGYVNFIGQIAARPPPRAGSRTNLARSISALVCFHGILDRVKVL